MTVQGGVERIRVRREVTAGLTARQAVAVANERLKPREEGRLVAFASSPERWAACVVRGAELQHPEGSVDPTEVFELRIVSPRGEVRWISDGPRRDEELRGRCAITLLGSDASLGDGQECGALHRSYLCWGGTEGRLSASEADVDWWELRDASIGSVLVPLTTGQQFHPVRLDAVELIEHDEFGNARVTDEICLGFAWSPEERGDRDD
jgi:CRISPR-associated protein (TIGR03984 family)